MLLESEKGNIKNDLDQMASQAKRAFKSYELEKRSLMQQVQKLQRKLEKTSNNYFDVVKKVQLLKSNIESLKTKYEEQVHQNES